MTTNRRDVLLAGIAATAVASNALGKEPARFRIALANDYEGVALNAAPWDTLGPDVETVSFNKPLNTPQETIRALRDFDAVILMRERTPIPRQVLESLPRLKLIVFSGQMNATLDHKAASERNIVVAQAMGMGDSGEVGGGAGELAFALMLACAWHIPAADALIRSGGWVMQPQIPLKIPLGGKTLGIPGYGAIGSRVGVFAKALGMKVLGYSRSLTEEMARADGITRAPDLDTVMRDSDVISVHLPYTNQTRGMIGAKELALMKPGVIFINTARAPIVDEKAFLEAVRTRRIAMAGLDVYSVEPLPRTHELMKLPNVVMTPHIGYVSGAGFNARYRAVFQVVADYRKGTVKPYTPSARDMA
jgi:phosphoglycerate dehydrogenase-like enzyme